MLNNKLYPPYIEGSLPAFTYQIINDPVTNEPVEHPIMYIQYTLNRGVSPSEISGYSLQIKKITTNQFIGSIENGELIDEKNTIKFDLNGLNLIKGQYYKFQLAFINKEGVIGYYSTPGIARYIEIPKINISKFDGETMRVEGNYDPDNSGEYLYSYRFYLQDYTGKLLEDSENILYNSSNIDANNNSFLEYTFKYMPIYGQRYRAYLEITTGNNYIAITDNGVDVMAMPSINPEVQLKVIATNVYSEGYIEIAVQPLGDPTTQVTGAFALGRASSKDNFRSYEPILKFEFINEIPNRIIYKDLFVEYGIEYKYAIQQYNANNIYSKKIWSNLQWAWFEDLFLTDGKQQFKIKYNPKVSSIKTTIQESKIDTLGGQYPFIFRNGNVKYKELPISGLISYLADENEMFFNLPDNFNITTDLTDENISVEYQFKMKAMEWLNNGEVKFFKSPIEGSLLVQLMNVSLSPNDTLGRMLHTFNCTAYEIGELNYNNLVKYNFINSDYKLTSDNTIIIEELTLVANKLYTLQNIFTLEFIVNSGDNGPTTLEINGSEITIPKAIKSYYVDLAMPEVTIKTKVACKIIYQRENTITSTSFNNDFNKIEEVIFNDSITIAQFNYVEPQANLDIINAINKDNKEIAFFAYLQFYKNPNQTSDYTIRINNIDINIENTNDYQLRNIDYITSLTIGKGVVLECGYYLNEIKKVKE